MNKLVLKNLQHNLVYIENDLKSYNIDFGSINKHCHFQVDNSNNPTDIYIKLLLYKIILNLTHSISSGNINIFEYGILNLKILTVCDLDIQDSMNTVEQLFNQYYSGLIIDIKRTISNLFVTIYLGKLKLKLHVIFIDYKNSSWNFPQVNEYTILDSFSRPNINYSFKRHSKYTFMPKDPNNSNIANNTFVISGEYIDFIKPEDLFL